MERTARQVVVEADIEGSVGVRGKDDSRLAGDISGTTVLVADGIFNLRTHTHERVMSSLAFSLSLSLSPPVVDVVYLFFFLISSGALSSDV